MKLSRSLGLLACSLILPVSVWADVCPNKSSQNAVADQLDQAVGAPIANLALAYDPKEVAKNLESQGLKCEPFSPELGLQCQGIVKSADYPEPVLIVVPINYKPKKQAEQIWHFHGNLPWIKDEKGNPHPGTFEDVRKMSKFAEGLAASGRDGILIVPSSKGETETYKTYLTSEEGFERLFNSVGTALTAAGLVKKPQPQPLVLTSHSGGYRVLVKATTYPKFKDQVTEMHFFDSLYAAPPEFLEYAKAHPKTKITSVFNQNSPTEEGAFGAWLALNPEVKTGLAARKQFYDEIEPGCLKNLPSLCFTRTRIEHNDAMAEYFGKILKSPSGLNPKN